MLGIKRKKKNGNGESISNVNVGKPLVKPSDPSHVRGVRRGNARGNFEREEGLYDAPEGAKPDGGRATARRSTGINPNARNPIDPRMPNLPPS
jgi:hypothetical protein